MNQGVFRANEILFRPKSDVKALEILKVTRIEDLLRLLRNLILSGSNWRGSITVY